MKNRQACGQGRLSIGDKPVQEIGLPRRAFNIGGLFVRYWTLETP